RDVRGDAKRENGNGSKVAAGKQIQHAQQSPADVVPNLIEAGFVDAGRSYVRSQAVDCQHAPNEKDPPPQIRHIEHIANSREKFLHKRISALDFVLCTLSRLKLTQDVKAQRSKYQARSLANE